LFDSSAEIQLNSCLFLIEFIPVAHKLFIVT
jgi:hypothetical protein